MASCPSGARAANKGNALVCLSLPAAPLTPINGRRLVAYQISQLLRWPAVGHLYMFSNCDLLVGMAMLQCRMRTTWGYGHSNKCAMWVVAPGLVAVAYDSSRASGSFL